MHDVFDYIRKQDGLNLLFTALAAKYESLGRFGGTIHISNPTNEEREAINNFLRVADISSSTDVNIPVSQVVEAYEQSKLSDIPLLTVLEYIMGKKLIPTRLKKQLTAQCKKKLLQTIQDKYRSSMWCQQWLTAIKEKHPVSNSVWRQYKSNPVRSKEILDTVCKALSLLEVKQDTEHLSIFSCKVGKNPHLLDSNTPEGKGLYHALKFLQGEGFNKEYTTPEAIHYLYKRYGLLRENIINQVYIAGILGYDHHGNEIPVLKAACESNFLLPVPLRELHKVDNAKPYLPTTIIYITENPSVFSTILEQWEPKRPFPPLVCTAGNMKVATIRLLRSLAKSGCRFLYSGDFDPEGLLAADKLLQLFPYQSHLWGLTKDNYVQRCSNKHMPVTEKKRIHSLKSIINPSLQDLVKTLKQHQFRVVSEEELIPYLMQSIKKQHPL